MDRIKGVKRLTENRFLNLYELDARQRDGKAITYYVASRAKGTENLKSVSGHRRADGVIMYGVYGEQKDKIVLIRQYRYPLGDYIYEFPAGLVEPGEDVREAGIREMFEETGLTFTPREGGDFERPFFTTVGMTDESCAMLLTKRVMISSRSPLLETSIETWQSFGRRMNSRSSLSTE
jgi:ADP-ribose pyrophosphatase